MTVPDDIPFSTEPMPVEELALLNHEPGFRGLCFTEASRVLLDGRTVGYVGRPHREDTPTTLKGQPGPWYAFLTDGTVLGVGRHATDGVVIVLEAQQAASTGRPVCCREDSIHFHSVR